MTIRHGRSRAVGVSPEILAAGLSLADLGLYVKVEQLQDVLEGDVTVDAVVQALVHGATGPVPGSTAEDLRAGVERLVRWGIYTL
ncbi:hypothetical protein OG413_46035 [Streptomyces sp. NBC_01433]|uniref:hypothetical protein n=1 Tax=Streptomyces sp. NBC_01433 TaxID=2903864 RepID=UPI0022542B0D|nr:hypothetical protein [Streptomyces sp. NBC_01433]MCX4682494.1 hypothetical protein [Streptomyces sp. NBC_01433]MCX4682547.1 hypothetical protein [Streptomyces sp. NBC_01433]